MTSERFSHKRGALVAFAVSTDFAWVAVHVQALAALGLVEGDPRFYLVIAGVQRPMIRKLSGVTGAELWAKGTIVLDDREGWAADVAVTPDGHLLATGAVATAGHS